MVSVAKEDVYDISTNKFEPWNLIRLHPILGFRPSPDEAVSNVDITAGAVTLKKKAHTEKDYAIFLVNMPRIRHDAPSTREGDSSIHNAEAWLTPISNKFTPSQHRLARSVSAPRQQGPILQPAKSAGNSIPRRAAPTGTASAERSHGP
ncbi:hypothetical protein E4U31_007866 [Claviceps sp. LM219 group G6]|nr:hypothetical protein E4U31_007866 [Claviceps sp. LM219 group G6]